MNQHHIQKAYFKSFTDKGLVWVTEKNTDNCYRKPISWCTAEEDFQSEDMEKFQNRKFETHGIRALKKIINGKSIEGNDFENISGWIALHLVRNQHRKKMLYKNQFDYEQNVKNDITIDKKYLKYFNFVDVYNCSKNQYLITSDYPILEFEVENKMALFFPLTPKKLFFMSNDGRRINHEHVEFIEMVNSMIYTNCYKYIFSNKKDINIQKYKNSKDWNLEYKEEIIQFTIEGE